MNLHLRSSTYAEVLRTKATPAEIELCRILDAARISYVFQSSIFDMATGRMYIADFRIRRIRVGRPKGMPRKHWHGRTQKLFVEVDGPYHQYRQAYDQRRSRWIESHRDADILRFTNADVFQRPAEIMRQIESYNPARRTVRRSATSPFATKWNSTER